MGLLLTNVVEISDIECERRTRCFKMLLDKGADPTLQMSRGHSKQSNMFEIELQMGPKVSGNQNGSNIGLI